MLGSTADSLFWMFRYIERVENTLCMIESGFQLYLLSSSNLYNEWDAILRTNSIRHHFLKKNNSLDSLNIINFMFKDPKNLNNILTLIGKARENARRSRVSITLEVWEAINTCWLYLNEELNKKINESKIQIIIKNTREKIALIFGFLERSMLKNEILNFCYLGAFIERFDNTARILNTRYYLLLEEKKFRFEGYDNFQLEMILRSISSYRSFMWKNQNEIKANKVSYFLISDKDMPKSLMFCVNENIKNLKSIHKKNFSKKNSYLNAFNIQTKIKQKNTNFNNYSFLNSLFKLNMTLAANIEEEFNFQ